MKHIDLFSGIGGFALAATWVWGDEYENVGHSEIEKYPCQIYHRHFPESECLGDITKIDWSRFSGTIDLITAGFPCQPHSVAGKRKGAGDERDLWHECVRTLRELRPRFAIFENVPGILSSNNGQFFNRVLSDISESGYDAEWKVLSAAEVGAWHRRERIWIVAYPNERGVRCSSSDVSDSEKHSVGGRLCTREQGGLGRRRSGDIRAEIPDTERTRLEGTIRAGGTSPNGCSPEYGQGRWQADWWAVEPNVGRVAHGVSDRVDRLKGLGNAIVPQCAMAIMQQIKSSSRQT
jgi:DNA (cytosine-5)-methyltransferase 1